MHAVKSSFIALVAILGFLSPSGFGAEPGEITQIQPSQWSEKLTDTSGVQVLIISSEHCSLCVEAHPMLEKTAKELGSRVQFLELSLDQADAEGVKKIAEDLGITMLPGVMLLKDGHPVRQVLEANPTTDLASEIRPLLPLEESDCDVAIRLELLGIESEEARAAGNFECPDCIDKAKPKASPQAENVTPACSDRKIVFEPFSVPGITENLNTQSKVQLRSLHGKRLANLGEGFSMVTPFLVARGVDSFAIDLSDAFKSVSKVPEGFGPRYIFGDATKLSKLSIARGKFDHIISTLLLCELDYANAEKALIENIKALKAHGVARHAFWTHEAIDLNSPAYAKMLRHVQEWAKRNQIKITLATANGQVINGKVVNGKHPEFQLLEIRRE